ncbi:conserved hypothetical protein [Clostridium neonatale]|uniref:hypothetical protein n=1 Tax=Clostridium neonatale TaxID=137838 RepID=UPI001D391A12|nr:hypothetical protein [Clostridium neonatale]CAG9702621.1 conserved hypothetical protein [Clostridium neonatale]
MTKENELFSYFNDNNGEERGKLIKAAVKKFNVKEGTARTIYYRWKSEFMGTENCIPKEQKKIEKLKPKEKQEIKVPHDVVPIDANKEIKKSNLRIKSAVIEGKYIDYQIVDGAVKVGKEVFKNESDIDRYRKEQLIKFYEQIGEIAEVLEMIN